jgi:protoporphyrinogen oxidase
MCEVTSPGGAPYPGPETERELIDGLVHAGLMRRDELLFVDKSENRFAYIVYDLGFAAKKRTALAWLDEVGAHALGRFGHYEYDNSDECVIKARALAQVLLRAAVRG